MTTAFVLSGGANLGAVQVGMLRALHEADIHPDVLIGSSVGAVNAAWLAGADRADGIDGLAEIWRSLDRGDVFPLRLWSGLSAFLGRRPGLFESSGLRRLVRRHIAFDRLERAPIPLHVVATDVLDGRDVRFESGPTVDVIMASAAIPGIYEPVEIDGRQYIDGGVINNAPISHAVDLDVDTIYVLPTGYACSLKEAPTSALGMTLHALSLMVNRRLSIEIEHFIETEDIRVVPPPCPLDVGPGEFDRAEELMDKGYESATTWLASSAHTAVNTLAVHDRAHRELSM